MKHMKFAFVAVAFMAIFSAFGTKENSIALTFKKYAYLEKFTAFVDGTNRQIITVKDITGQIQGTPGHYDCIDFDGIICTFETDDQYIRAGVSATGGLPYVWTSQVNPTLSAPLNAVNVVDDAIFIDLE